MKAAANVLEDTAARLKTQNETLRLLLTNLVEKIDAEAKRGHPLHPLGQPTRSWIAGHPYQLDVARRYIQAQVPVGGSRSP